MAGGVAANGALRERMLAWGAARGVVVRLPEQRYCTDNAAMIASAARFTDPVPYPEYLTRDAYASL